MRKKALVSLVFAAALISHPTARAQQGDTAIVGFLTSGFVTALNTKWIEAFHRGLGQSGYVEGKSVAIKFRGAGDDYGLLEGLATELVTDGAQVIVAAGGPVSVL